MKVRLRLVVVCSLGVVGIVLFNRRRADDGSANCGPLGERTPLPVRKPKKKWPFARLLRPLFSKSRDESATTVQENGVSRIWDALKEAQAHKATASAPSEDYEHHQKKSDDRRKSKRSVHRVPLLVYGSNPENEPFHEEVYTVEVSDSGCLFSLAMPVLRGQRLVLINMRTQDEKECRVVHVGRRTQGRTRIGIEFVRAVPDFWKAG